MADSSAVDLGHCGVSERIFLVLLWKHLLLFDISSEGDIAPVEGLTPAAVTNSVAIGADFIHTITSATIRAIVTGAATAFRIMTSCGKVAMSARPCGIQSRLSASVTHLTSGASAVC
jgi:hypothetical protein